MRKLPPKETLLILALVLLLILGGWWQLPFLSGEAVDAVHPKRGPAVQSVFATGTVEPTVMVPIASQIGARLAKLNVDEGSKVTKGQVLGELETQDMQQSLNELRAREDFAKKDYDRKSDLLKRGFATKADYDRAFSDWEAAKAQTRAAQAQVSFRQLLAPDDGTIIRRDGEIGQMIPANQAVFWMSCCAPLRISAEVDEEDISLVQPDQKVLIRADAFPGKIFEGKVQSITPKGDPVARSYRVRIVFSQDVPLLIGMTAETNIISYEKQDALLIPTAALTRDKVWLVKNGRLKQQAVSVGAKGVEQTEILQGVGMDDVVVAKSEPGFKEGKSVRASLVSF